MSVCLPLISRVLLHHYFNTFLSLFLLACLLSLLSPQPLPPSGTLMMQRSSLIPLVLSLQRNFPRHIKVPPPPPPYSPCCSLPHSSPGTPPSNKHLQNLPGVEAEERVVGKREGRRGHTNTRVSPVPLTHVRSEQLGAAVTPATRHLKHPSP